MIKVEDVSDPLTETPARVSEAVLLFCQVTFFFYKIKRRKDTTVQLHFGNFEGQWPVVLCTKTPLKTRQYLQQWKLWRQSVRNLKRSNIAFLLIFQEVHRIRNVRKTGKIIFLEL